MSYRLLRPLLFGLDAETSHGLATAALEAAQWNPLLLQGLRRRNHAHDGPLRKTVAGIEFPNPIGLAAGFDKNAKLVEAMAALGFGFVEVGTVTPRPQVGNPKPRLFRLPEEQSLQNAMGFNNDGMDVIHRRLKRGWPYSVPVGVNLGKNKDTPDEKTLDDYLMLLEKFADVGDYYVINVSSPNTPGLRDFQNDAFVREVFSKGREITDKPIFLKVAPDGQIPEIVGLCKTAVDTGAAGIIATNTSIDYTLTPHARDFGGLSGAVIREKSFEVFRAIAKELRGACALISVGGVDSSDEAERRLDSGADLVQVYTALIYNGPNFVRDVTRELADRTKR